MVNFNHYVSIFFNRTLKKIISFPSSRNLLSPRMAIWKGVVGSNIKQLLHHFIVEVLHQLNR